MDYFKDIIWQPASLHMRGDFRVLLNRGFAQEMFNVHPSLEMKRSFDSVGVETARGLGIDSIQSPYELHEGTGFLRGVYIRTGNGIWLTLSGLSGRVPDFSKPAPLVYDSHNIVSRRDAFNLLALFDSYVYYSDVLKEQATK